MYQVQYRTLEDKVLLQRNELRVPKIDEVVCFLNGDNTINKNAIWKVTGVCNLVPKGTNDVTSYLVMCVCVKEFMAAYNIDSITP